MKYYMCDLICDVISCCAWSCECNCATWEKSMYMTKSWLKTRKKEKIC